MRIGPRLAINLVAVLAIGIVMVAWVITQIVGTGIGEQPIRVTADFETTGGVFTNQEVTYRGVLVGQVGELSLTDDGVDVELLIEPEWDNKIPANSIANIQSKSAVGEQFVNLTPVASGGDMLTDGDTIARSNTRLPVDFQELLVSIDNVLSDIPPEQTRRAISNLAAALEGRQEDIATILRSLADLSETFAETAPAQQRLLANATEAGAAFLGSKQAFAEAIKAADEVFAGIGDEPAELKQLFVSNDRFARNASRFLRQHGDDLHAGIKGLRDLVSFQLRNKEDVLRGLDYIPDFLHAIEDASIPWRSPDGREFYRIRVGLVYDDVEASWPCKYVRPFGYERQPHFRTPREINTNLTCRARVATSGAAADSLVASLRAWLRENPAREQWDGTPEQIRERYFDWANGARRPAPMTAELPQGRDLDQ